MYIVYKHSPSQTIGVKGPSWLSCLKHFDLVKSVSPEYMHLALLGVSKLVLNLWLKESVAMHANLSVIEKRIKQIEVPTEICREPRSLSEVKHWKGTSIFSGLKHFPKRCGYCYNPRCLLKM